MFEVAYTLYEASRATGIPVRTLKHFVQNGQLPTVRLGRAARVIRRSSLDEFLATHEGRSLDEDEKRLDTETAGQLMAEAVT